MEPSSGSSWQLSLGIEDLSAARFAISPLYETVQALGALRRWGAGPALAGWERWARRRRIAESLRTPLLDELVFNDRPRYPEFLTPSPGSLWTTAGDELETVGRTDHEAIRASFGRIWHDAALPPAAQRVLEDPETALAELAEELRCAHDALVAPHWSRLHPLLEADVAFKARRLVQGGFDAVFARLHPDAGWDGTTLRVGLASARRVRLSPGGLVLAPTVFGAPVVTAKFTSSSRTVVRYPARGIGSVFLEPPRAVSGGLSRLLGAGRARVFAQLTTPRTPTELAATLRVTPSAVSQHLRVLRDGGLVRADRIGRSVVYTLSTTGSALLSTPGNDR